MESKKSDSIKSVPQQRNLLSRRLICPNEVCPIELTVHDSDVCPTYSVGVHLKGWCLFWRCICPREILMLYNGVNAMNHHLPAWEQARSTHQNHTHMWRTHSWWSYIFSFCHCWSPPIWYHRSLLCPGSHHVRRQQCEFLESHLRDE